MARKDDIATAADCRRIGKKLEVARQSHGMVPGAAAEAAGVSRQFWLNFCLGKRNARVETIARMAAAVKLKIRVDVE